MIDGGKIWRCEKRGACKARVHTNAAGNVVTQVSFPHNQMADRVETELRDARARMKEKVVTTTTGAAAALRDELPNLSVAAKGRIGGRMANVKRQLNRNRVQTQGAPANPANRPAIVLPQEYQVYHYAPGDG